GSPATLWATSCWVVHGPGLFGGVPDAVQLQVDATRVNAAVAVSAGGPVWFATSGFAPSASLTVFRVIEPLMAPLALCVSVTESTVGPALAVVKATVTGPPCGFQLAPASDTTCPGPAKQPPPEAGLAVSVATSVWNVTVAVAEMVPATGVVLGWV